MLAGVFTKRPAGSGVPISLGYDPVRFTAAGKTQPGATVTILADGVQVATVTAGPGGDWSHRFAADPAPRVITATSLVSAPGVTAKSLLMLCGHRLNTMGTGDIITSARAYGVSEVFFGTPAWHVKRGRFRFDNFWVDFSGSSLPEKNTNGAKRIEAAAVKVGGAWVPLTFDGQAGATIADGGFVYADPLGVDLPKNSFLPVRVAWNDIVGARSIGTYRRDAITPSGVKTVSGYYGSTTLAAKVTDGSDFSATSTGVSGSYTYLYGPSCLVGEGWDGSPVVMVMGDSIVHADDNPDERIVDGYLPRTLDDPVGGRVAYGDFSKGGLSFTSTFYNNQFAKRKATLDALPNVPFTHIWMNLGVNDAAQIGGATLADVTEAWKERFRVGANTLKGWFPGVPIIFNTMTPRSYTITTTGGVWRWTTNKDYLITATNTPTDDPVTDGIANTQLMFWDSGKKDGPGRDAPRQAVNAWLVDKTDPALAGSFVVDTRPAFFDPEKGDRWRVIPERGTLVNAVASGVKVFVVTAPIRKGSLLVIDPGVTAQSSPGMVMSSVDNANGTWTITTQNTITKAHAAGVTVASYGTDDRTHPKAVYHDDAKAIALAWKVGGGLAIL